MLAVVLSFVQQVDAADPNRGGERESSAGEPGGAAVGCTYPVCAYKGCQHADNGVGATLC